MPGWRSKDIERRFRFQMFIPKHYGLTELAAMQAHIDRHPLGAWVWLAGGEANRSEELSHGPCAWSGAGGGRPGLDGCRDQLGLELRGRGLQGLRLRRAINEGRWDGARRSGRCSCWGRRSRGRVSSPTMTAPSLLHPTVNIPLGSPARADTQPKA